VTTDVRTEYRRLTRRELDAWVPEDVQDAVVMAAIQTARDLGMPAPQPHFMGETARIHRHMDMWCMPIPESIPCFQSTSCLGISFVQQEQPEIYVLMGLSAEASAHVASHEVAHWWQKAQQRNFRDEAALEREANDIAHKQCQKYRNSKRCPICQDSNIYSD
jgi:hypothetical protein